jgi:hypothetical protein
MFQSSARRFRVLLSLADDLLGDPPQPEAPHPHRRPLRFRPERRRGSVSPRPAQCLSPVRPSSRRERREQLR